jgi:hypothetical protein
VIERPNVGLGTIFDPVAIRNLHRPHRNLHAQHPAPRSRTTSSGAHKHGQPSTMKSLAIMPDLTPRAANADSGSDRPVCCYASWLYVRSFSSGLAAF